MEAEQRSLLQVWWTKSCHDLAAVRLLLAAEPPSLGIAVYHCQQAAEKAIKAWLVWKEVPFCVLVPKLRLGTRLLAKLCFGGGTVAVDTRAHRAPELRRQGRSQTEFGNEVGKTRSKGLRLAAEVLDLVKQHCPFLT